MLSGATLWAILLIGISVSTGVRQDRAECPDVDPKNTTVLLPDPSGDCTKFVMCHWGTPVSMDCPRGTYFNPNKSICDWPKDSGCVQPTEEPRPACPPDDPVPAVPVPGNCTVFYLCSNGVPTTIPCPEGLYFNPVLRVCDWPQDSGCVQPTEMD